MRVCVCEGMYSCEGMCLFEGMCLCEGTHTGMITKKIEHLNCNIVTQVRTQNFLNNY